MSDQQTQEVFEEIEAPIKQRIVREARRFVLPALCAVDSYKLGHADQYAPGTDMVASNLTPRFTKYMPRPADVSYCAPFWDEKVTWAGVQGYLHKLKAMWDDTFFSKNIEEAILAFRNRTGPFVGDYRFNEDHLRELHRYGRLPITIRALPEGTRVNAQVPVLLIYNTRIFGYWITNYLETMLSAELWKPSVVGTITGIYRKILSNYADLTGASKEFIDWQIHGFQPRGMSGILDDACNSWPHLIYSCGTDSIPSVEYAAQIYRGDEGFIAGSVPATEHSVTTQLGPENELAFLTRLITEVYPKGIFSCVMDGFDYWNVLTTYMPALKEMVLSRGFDSNGFSKVVCRPDSGNPVDIITGTAVNYPLSTKNYAFQEQANAAAIKWARENVPAAQQVFVDGEYLDIQTGAIIPAEQVTAEMLGSIRLLWNTFGGEVNEKGFKVLSNRVGLIYGDSITPQRMVDILERLMFNGFTGDGVVFGVGSYTYQYITRDSAGMAIKATFSTIQEKEYNIFKDPATDPTKKSATGLVRAIEVDGELVCEDKCTWDQILSEDNKMVLMFDDGDIVWDESLNDIRARAREQLGC